MPTGHLKRLPLHGSKSFIDIDVRKGTVVDTKNWDALVQPHIVAARPAAPDAKWGWSWLLRRSIGTERALGRNVSLFCLDVAGNNGKAIPLGMVMLSEGYPSLDGNNDPCVYLWYLAAAPSGALTALGANSMKPSMILEALLDVSIQRSFELGYDGRVGLHAHKSGGDGLFVKYRDRTRMRALSNNVSISFARQLVGGNDGRYFWVDPKLSQALSNSLNYLR